jgi:CheY-like chemotaxis protein
MQFKHTLDNSQACEEIELVHTKLSRSIERRMECCWQEFEKHGRSFSQFLTAVLEALIILDHRDKLRLVEEMSKKILDGNPNGGIDCAMICEMAERALNAKAGLGVPPAEVSRRLQRALEADCEPEDERSGAALGLWDAPAKPFRVLVVEDEAPVARDIANILQDAGFEAVGPASGPARALELVSSVGCDAAVLDIRLGRHTSEPVALALRERGTPFIAVSAYSRAEMPAGFGDSPLLDKPLQPKLLIAHLRRCIEGQGARLP